MKDFIIDKNGLGSFPILETQFGVKNVATVDNSVWGNMNPYYADGEDDKKRIEKNDRKITEMLGAEAVFEMTTPIEDTFIDLTKETIQLLRYKNRKYNSQVEELVFFPLRANAVILTERNIELVAAPADCAIAVCAHPVWKGVIVIHVGGPQVIESLPEKVLTYFSCMYRDVDMKQFQVFVFPYVCSKHYMLDEKDVAEFPKFVPDFGKYLEDDGTGKKRCFAFNRLFRDGLQEKFGIENITETGLCTYEEALEGRLFSHQLADELEEKEGKESEAVKKARGNFNVAVAMG